MLISYKPSWRQICQSVGPSLAAVFVIAVAATVLDFYTHDLRMFSMPDLPLTLIGALLAILLGFRTNSAYGRWWEARTIWGAVVNDSRSWARQIVSFTTAAHRIAPEEVESFRREMIHSQIAYVNALRCHLRGEDPVPAVRRFLDDDAQIEKLGAEKNVPAAMVHHMAIRVSDAASRGMLSDFRLVALSNTLGRMIDYQGGSERIKNTPFPRQYDYYPEFVVRAYCFLFPLAIVDNLGFVTPVLTLLIALALLLVNEIGAELEAPFDDLVNGMPLNTICRTIEINLRQQLGETQLPQPIAPINGVLT